MKKLLAACVFVMSLVSVSGQQIKDPNVELRQVKGFTSIKVSSAIDLVLAQGDEAVAVSADKVAYRDNIKTVVEGGVLRISFENTGRGISMNLGNHKLKAYVSIRELKKLQASGASDVIINGKLTGEEIEIEMSGASDLKGEVDIKNLKLKLSGASDASLSGRVVNLYIDANGASDFKGYDLESNECYADASGASDIKIQVKKELSARAAGASGIYYKGDAVIRDLKSSGGSSVSKR